VTRAHTIAGSLQLAHGRCVTRAPALPSDDSVLLRGAADGDWRCIAALYDRHRDGALAVATSVLADPSEAEDVVHDTFVDLPRMARSYDARRGRLTQWLYRSIRNRAIDHVRRRSRVVSRTARSADGPETLLEMIPARGASPGDEAEAHELLELIARLDGRYAPLIRLSFVDGWSHSAIAHMTGLPLGTVKTRIRNGLRQLRPLIVDIDVGAANEPATSGIRRAAWPSQPRTPRR
jgi:RNA polymerase sigma-70 factor, ECF subfamily